uniref:ABC transporter extracellular solute-binding protein n=1 Tax=uncultured bacterium W4-39b TaxID=1130994 RepID=H9BWS3_9BACT|nr:ABC transporter extracellular solute-binding protein [uncultured bacterium W4-39b]
MRQIVLKLTCALALILGFVAVASQAQVLEDKLVIVTSYPPDTTETVKAAFNKAYPGIQVEMLKKKTTAGIKYLQETAGNNQSDLFWASAPDAFEVLKEDGLLVKYQVKIKGIPDMVGSFPIHDPDGYYKGFAASGYGIMWNTRYLKAKKLPAPAEWGKQFLSYSARWTPAG